MTLRWRPGYTTTFADPDVQSYLTRVEEADNQALEYPVAVAIDEFVRGCKADGIWTAIKASCILAGARTLNGALVPLAGTAPTNFNFVSSDYDRKTGLVGNGSTKYLNSNRNNNADPQDSNHNAVWVSTAESGSKAYMGASTATTQSGDNNFGRDGTAIFNRNRTFGPAGTSLNGAGAATGLIGINRSLSTSYVVRASGNDQTNNVPSQTPFNGNISVFASGTGAPTNARLAFYSIGESLSLALLDARVTALINRFAAVIP